MNLSKLNWKEGLGMSTRFEGEEDGGGGGGGGDEGFLAGLSDEFKATIPEGFSEKFKGKSEEDIVKSHIELETMANKKLEGMVKIPGDDASDEDKAAFKTALGVPDNVEAYDLTIPEGVTEADAAVFKGMGETVAAAALEAGVPPSMIKPVYDKAVATLAQQNKEAEEAGMKIITDEIDSQKTELGEKYPIMVEGVARTIEKMESGEKFKTIMNTFGMLQLDENKKITGGSPEIMQFMNELAPLILEGKTHLGTGEETKGEGWFTDYASVGDNSPVNI